VVSGALPAALEEFVVLAWLHGDQEYDAIGGDARFFQAASRLLDEVASTQEGPPQPSAPLRRADGALGGATRSA
jgi:hypothetical protein